ncbi:MAG: Na+/H+ antiporter subunit E [Candidatus Aenigmatarchaeota archaeon]|nr:MAG: Na+/H+ antiporter subunit E [Candidatus Aenigmarchaeota archaeon]
MVVPLIVFVFSMLTYLALTVGSGQILFWSIGEIIFGIVFSLITTLIVARLLDLTGLRPGFAWLNPVRWAIFFVFAAGPFLFNMVKANLEVASMVITRRIRPGIVKVHSGLRTEFATSMLANSITLTPGTLSVDTDKGGNLYVHMLYVEKKQLTADDVCSGFHKWIKRVAE